LISISPLKRPLKSITALLLLHSTAAALGMIASSPAAVLPGERFQLQTIAILVKNETQ
jgi:hypothetical protein